MGGERMKERIVYAKYKDEEKDGEFSYYKKKQRFIWSFYLRVIMEHFIPCDKCQAKIEKLWNIGYVTSDDWHNDKFIQRVVLMLCKQCNKKIYELNENAEVIVGNKDYTPPVELSRKWTDDDNSIEEVTEKEYNEHKHPTFRV